VFSTRSDLPSGLRAPGYLILALVCTQPLIEVVANTWPLRFGITGWRFGFFGAASGALLLPLLGLFLIYALAAQAGDRRVVMTVAGLASLAALFCVVATGAFALDALQMRAQVRADAATSFKVVSLWATGKLVAAAIASLVLTVSAFRTARSLNREARRTSAKSSPLIVGRTVEPLVRGTETAAEPTGVPSSE
jgi:hypothetical protein